jgi:hypothetical protein
MAIGSHGHARIAPHVFAREFDGEVILLDLAGGNYFGLDELGARLWAGILGGHTPYEVAKDVGGEYQVEFARLLEDLTHLADELAERGLLVASP